MNIIIDCREKSLFTACEKIITDVRNFSEITISSENLEIGDIIIRNDKGEEKLIIERKSIQDLISSISDGRYREQSYRLDGSDMENHNIIYLIEGSIRNLSRHKQMVYSSLFSLNYFKGFSVFRSETVEESAYIIINAAYKILKEKGKVPYYSKKEAKADEERISEEETNYCTVVKRKKNANVTPSNFGEIVLVQIPGISSITAIAIMNKFKTIHDLIHDVKHGGEILKTITYTTEKKLQRKITKTSINNIMEFLA